MPSPPLSVPSCEVAAEPSEGVSFEWRVNSTTTSNLDKKRLRRRGNVAVSVAKFTPRVSFKLTNCRLLWMSFTTC